MSNIFEYFNLWSFEIRRDLILTVSLWYIAHMLRGLSGFISNVMCSSDVALSRWPHLSVSQFSLLPKSTDDCRCLIGLLWNFSGIVHTQSNTMLGKENNVKYYYCGILSDFLPVRIYIYNNVAYNFCSLNIMCSLYWHLKTQWQWLHNILL